MTMDRDRALSLLDSYTRTRLDARALHPLLLELAEALDRAPTQVIPSIRKTCCRSRSYRWPHPGNRCAGWPSTR